MRQIYRYPANQSLPFPEGGNPDQPVIHLCDVEGWQYLSIPDSAPLHETWEGPLDLTAYPDLKKVLRKNALPCQEINERLQESIRDQYPLEDELRALRVGDAEYQQFMATIISEADTAKSALGV
jgi:hypothetical protein